MGVGQDISLYTSLYYHSIQVDSRFKSANAWSFHVKCWLLSRGYRRGYRRGVGCGLGCGLGCDSSRGCGGSINFLVVV